MAKIIAVWGNPGAGKSMLSSILTKALTFTSEKALLMSGDRCTPMLPVWTPEQITGSTNSIGQILSTLDITSELVSAKMVVHKKYPYIGLLGYAAGENKMSYPEVQRSKVDQLLRASAKLVDYLILDCPSDILDPFFQVALRRADVGICCLSPDLRGLSYIKAHKALLENSGIKIENHRYFASQARPFHSLDAVGKYIGRWDGILPYTKEVDRWFEKGDMFAAAGCCHKKYADSIDRILDACDAFEETEDFADSEMGFPLNPVANNEELAYNHQEGGTDENA